MTSSPRPAPHLLLALLLTGTLAVGGCTSDATTGPEVISSSTAPASSLPTSGASVPGPAGSTTSGSSGATATGTPTPASVAVDNSPEGTATGTMATPTTTTHAATTATPGTRTVVPGNVNQTVATSAGTTKSPVPLTSTATFGGAVTAAVTRVTKTTLTATGPGEFTGPGVELTLAMTNGSAKPIDLSVVGVTVVGANGVAALPVQGSPASPFAGQLAPGKTSTAVYVFGLHSKPTNPVTVSVEYSAAAPVVAFTGSL